MIPDLAERITAFERRLRRSPTDRIILDYDEWLELKQAIITERVQHLELAGQLADALEAKKCQS